MLRYGLAVGTVALALWLTSLLWPLVKPSASPLFFAAVMMTAWYGGLGPGLLATALAVPAIYHFLIPGKQTLLDDLLRLAVFTSVAFLISWLTEARRRTAEALRESELKFRSVTQSAADAIIAADNEGKIIFWNQGAQNIFGYTEVEALGKALTFLMPGRYREAHSRGLERCQATGQPKLIGKAVELHGLKKDGSEFPLELSITTWETAEGNFYSGLIRDRTARKQAQEALQKANDELEKRVRERTLELSRANEALKAEIAARQQTEETLRESEERFRSAFDYAAIGKALVALDGRMLQVNRALCQILGYSESELLATIFQTTTHRDELKGDIEYMNQLLDGVIPSYQREKRYIHKSGQVVWVLESVSVVRDIRGKPVYFIAQTEDISRRKKVESEKQKLLHDLVERVKELTVLHHTARLLQDERRTTAEVLQEIVTILPQGWQYPELTAARILFDGAEYKTPNFFPTPWRQHAEFTTVGGKRGAVEILYLEEKPSEAEGPFQAEERNLINSLAEMLRSHLDRKEAEAEVAQVTKELVERNKELWRLQGEIGRVERLASVGRITGIIAHELGTPLNSVLGYIALLGQEQLSEQARRRLEIIEAEVHRMVGIIQHYLSHIRGSPRAFQEVHIGELIAETLELLKPIFNQHRVLVTSTLAESLPPVWGDGASLQRVLINLIDNAVDAMGEGGRLNVAARATAMQGTASSGVIIEITDTGLGIPSDLLPRIFDFLVTTKGPDRGTGLGLAVCQEIVKGHDGLIKITSHVGEGTCVRICLPAREGIEQPASIGVPE